MVCLSSLLRCTSTFYSVNTFLIFKSWQIWSDHPVVYPLYWDIHITDSLRDCRQNMSIKGFVWWIFKNISLNSKWKNQDFGNCSVDFLIKLCLHSIKFSFLMLYLKVNVICFNNRLNLIMQYSLTILHCSIFIKNLLVTDLFVLVSIRFKLKSGQ